MIATVEVERFSLTSSRPFDNILAAMNADVGHPDIVEFAKTTAAARTFPEFESTVRKRLAKSGLMLSLLAPYRNSDALAVAQDLDKKVEILLSEAAG